MFSVMAASSLFRDLRRVTNNWPCSIMAAIARESEPSLLSAGGNSGTPLPVRSAVRRASVARLVNHCPLATSSCERVWVSSNRTSTWPAETWSPSFAKIATIFPATKGWTALRLPLTTTVPTAEIPASRGASTAHIKKPPKPTSKSAQPQRCGRALSIST